MSNPQATLTEFELLRQKLELREAELRLKRGLPYLHGYKHYPWSLEFLNQRNKVCLLCAANQIGKSTAQIRRAIHWATETALWPELWPRDKN